MADRQMTSLLAFMALFRLFQASSWDAWRATLGRLTSTVREFYAIVGRGGGKSLIAALLATYYAVQEYARVPGESIYIAVFAPDRRQARVTFRYIRGLMRSVPALNALVESETQDSLTLRTGVIVEVLTASIASPRGRSYGLVILEEAAFLPQDASANPDVELLRAVRPALARVPGSLLVVISSPYARRGVLWHAWQRFHDQAPADVLLVQAPTLTLNPSFDARAIERAYEEDPASASAEYGAEFRADVESFLTVEAIDAAVVAGLKELEPRAGVTYHGFVDFAGGSGRDAATVAIAHDDFRDGRAVGVLDAVREVRPPFSPEAVCREFATILARYQVPMAVADRYAADFAREAMQRHGISLWPSDRSKSAIYSEFLPLLNSGRVELLDAPRLRVQLQALERRTVRGGRDTIDHPSSGHDDVANAACGALVEAVAQPCNEPSADSEFQTLLREAGRPMSAYEFWVPKHLRDRVGADDASTPPQRRLDRTLPGEPRRWFRQVPPEDEGGMGIDWDPFKGE